MAAFNGFDWPIVAILLMVIVSIILMWFSVGAGALLLSLVLVAGLDWHLPLWFWVIFWIIWVISLVAVIWSFFDWNAAWMARIGGFLTVLLMLAALVPWGAITVGNGPEASGPRTPLQTSAPSTSTTTTTSTVTVTQSPSSTVTAEQVIQQMCGRDKPFEQLCKDGSLRVGPKVDFNANPEERGIAAFSRKTLKTQQDIAQYLNGSSAESKATNARVVSAITTAGYGMDEVDRALDGSGYFPVQMTVAAQIMGTTYFHNGKVLEENGQWRTVGPNDIFWLFMTRDGKIIYGAAIRADCANVNLTKVRPIQPSTPPAPSVECPTECKPSTPSPSVTPSCPPGQHVSGYDHKTCVTPKDPTKDVNVNPDVPDQVKGPGTTRVGENPGPATKPTDGGTGCGGPCPGSSSTSSTSTSPSSSSTSTSAEHSLPAPTESPKPPPASPTVTTTIAEPPL